MHHIIGFDGQYLDSDTGTLHLGNGYRAYNPVLMRFNGPDIWSPFGRGGINLYAYCAGDPINRADPSGHFSQGQWIGMALSFVAGIALSILTEGAAMPVAMTLMATLASDAAIGAGAELVTEAVDKRQINWGQVGIAAGLSALASLAGFGVGIASKLTGTSNRPFKGMMIEPGRASGENISKNLTKEERMRNVERILVHELDEDSGEITSYRSSAFFSSNDTIFVNEYTPNAWVLIKNIRHNHDPFFASDVIEYQLNYVSRANDFVNIMPRKLVYDKVLNPEALGKIRGKLGSDLTDSFLESGLGKTTERILQYYDLHVDSGRSIFRGNDLTLYLKDDPRQLPL